jgi:competence protein ComEA
MGSVRATVAAVSEEEYRPVARQRLARVLTTPPSDHDRAQPEDPPTPPPAGTVARLAGSAFDPGRRGLRALAVVAVVVLLGAAVLAWWSRPRPEPVPMPPVTPVVAGTAGPAGPAATAPAELVVAVSGEVREPGLVHLPAGSRVADAIEAAGGLLPGADVDHLNLARKVTDGELITVGIPPAPESAGGVPDSGPGGKVNLNTASLDELETLPGIGPALAQRIIDYRNANGPFTSVGQLREVSGIGEVRFAELQDLVAV